MSVSKREGALRPIAGGLQAATLGGMAVAKDSLPQNPKEPKGVVGQGSQPQEQRVGFEGPAGHPFQVEFAFDLAVILLGGRMLAVEFHDPGFGQVQAGDPCLHRKDDPTLHQQTLACWHILQLPAEAFGDFRDLAHLTKDPRQSMALAGGPPAHRNCASRSG